MKSKLRFILLLLCVILSVGSSQYVKRSLDESFPIFKNYYFTYHRASNGPQYSNWTIATDIGLYAFAYNRDVLYTSTLHSIVSNKNTQGYEIQPEVTFMGASSVNVSIVDSAVNQLNQVFVWYSVRFLLFMAPKNSPIKVQTLTAMIYSTLGTSLYSMTNHTFPLQFSLSAPFYDSCYYDSTKTIKDKIHLAPALTKVNIQNPNYVNLTSLSNWEYDWNGSMLSVNFEVVVSSYISQALYVMVQVVGVCPNSYLFTSSNYSISIGKHNWLQLPPDTQGLTASKIVSLSTPLSNGTMIMKGMSITGLSLHDNNFPSTYLSFNITPNTDSFGNLEGTAGKISYYSLMPDNGYVNYWAMGYMGACPTNFDIYNTTHCYCSPAQQLTFDSAYSSFKCRAICTSGQYFDYALGVCRSCQVVYSYLCASCNATVCFNCTNGQQYYQPPSSSAVCLNCTTLYGNKCLYCSDQLCLNCANSYVSTLTSPPCSCSGQRYPSFNGSVETCVLCNGTFTSLCLTCTAFGCLTCDKGYKIVGGACVCNSPDMVINGSCYSCIQLYGSFCTACDASTCISCKPGLVLSSGVCLNCTDLFGDKCTNCNSSQCLSCSSNFTLNATYNCTCLSPSYTVINGTCTSCSFIFKCLTCTNSSCLSCQSSFSLVNGSCECPSGAYLSSTTCVFCSTTFAYCLACNSSACLQCPPLFNLSAGNCSCSVDRYIDSNGSCTLCSSLYGCLQCTAANACTLCNGSLTLINGACSCGSGLVNNGGSCFDCLTLYGLGCLTCDSSVCLSCDYNFQLSSGSCLCPSPSFALVSNMCTSCSQLFDFCIGCTNSSCLSCSLGHYLVNSICVCSNSQYQALNGSCTDCQSSFTNCLSCSWQRCYNCKGNYSIGSNQQCQCQWPMVQRNSNQCIACEDAYSKQQCTLSAQLQTFQSGSALYFRVKFNKPSQNVSQLVPIAKNLIVTVGGIQASLSTLHSNIFEIELKQKGDNYLVNISIIEPNYVSYQYLTLSTQPLPFNVSFPTDLILDKKTIGKIFEIRNYFTVLFGILSLGTFNRLFEQSTLICYFSHSYSTLPHSLGNIIDILNRKSIYQPLSLPYPFQDIHFQGDELRTDVYSFNKPISNISFQLLALAFCGLLLFIYIRGYLATKRNPRRHKAFRNILEHSAQYMLENWICIFSLLAYPAIYQIKLIALQGISNLNATTGTNLILSICLLFAPTCLIIIHLFQFFPSKRRYSVLYRQFKSQKALPVLLTLLTLLRPYTLVCMGLMLPTPFSQYIMLAYNFIHFFLMIVCAPFCLSIISYLLMIFKSSLSIYINIVLLLGEEQSILLQVAGYALVLITLIQITEAIFKLIRLVLRNKGLIEDSYEPIEGQAEEASRRSQEKKKQMTNKMMSYLAKARDQLGQILEKRKRRHIVS